MKTNWILLTTMGLATIFLVATLSSPAPAAGFLTPDSSQREVQPEDGDGGGFADVNQPNGNLEPEDSDSDNDFGANGSDSQELEPDDADTHGDFSITIPRPKRKIEPALHPDSKNTPQ